MPTAMSHRTRALASSPDISMARRVTCRERGEGRKPSEYVTPIPLTPAVPSSPPSHLRRLSLLQQQVTKGLTRRLRRKGEWKTDRQTVVVR